MHLSVHAHIFIQAYSLMRVHTHTHARIRARMCIHMHMTHTSTKCMHAYARGTYTHVPAQCSCMCTYAHARTRLHMRLHSCKHTPTYFGCALTDWGHTPQQEFCLGRPYLSLAVWSCLYCTRMSTPPAAKLVVEAESLSVGMVAQLEVSYLACHVMHKVVALASSSRPPLACWRISAVWSVCVEQLL